MPCQLTRHPATSLLPEPKGPVRATRDADARSSGDAIGRKHLTGTEPERRAVKAVSIAVTRDAEGSGETGGPAAERRIRELLLPGEATCAHVLDASDRLERADQHSGRKSALIRDDIEAPVNAVDAVDVRDSGLTEHRLVARGATDAKRGVRGVVVRSYVRFGFDDPAARFIAADRGYELHTEQLTRDHLRRARKEG